MTQFEAIIAVLNDHEKFNKAIVVELLQDLVNHIPAREITQSTFEDFLQIKQIEGDSELQSLASEMEREIEEADVDAYAKYIKDIRKEGKFFIPVFDHRYPHRLEEIPSPPLSLYVDGDLDSLDSGIAIVGTRSATDERISFAREIAGLLTEMDKTVVSGLANGIDSAGHTGAIEANGKTVAILPGRIGKIYPSGNSDLADKIRSSGALVSEVSKFNNFYKSRYVKRNRITSGMSEAVIIGASGESGGTVHQAKFSRDQAKPRFIYDSGNSDGQTPENVLEMGFKSFTTLDELENLLNSDLDSAAQFSVPTDGPTLNDF